MTPLSRIALVGTGGYGVYHLRALAELRTEGRARLAAVADPALAPGAEHRAKFEAEGVRAHASLHELLAAGGFDLLVLATPIYLHEEMTLAALATEVPAILLEKPPVPTPAQLARLVTADPRRRCAVAFQRLLSPTLAALKHAILDGALGRVRLITGGACWARNDAYYARAAWSGRLFLPDGRPVLDGPASNGLIHLLHNAAWLAGPELAAFAPVATVRGELYRARPTIECSDTAALAGRFTTGPAFAFAFTHACPEETPWEMRIFGDRAEARLADGGARLEIAGRTILTCDPDQDRLEIYRDTLRALAGERPRPATLLADCFPALHLTNGSLASSSGVHPLPAEWAQSLGEGPDRRYVIPGIEAAITRTLATGETFADQNLPWSIRTPEITPST